MGGARRYRRGGLARARKGIIMDIDYDAIVTQARDSAAEALETGLRSAKGLLDENDRLEEEISSGRWSDGVVKEYRMQQDHNKVIGLENARKSAMSEALSAIDRAEEKIRQSALPDPKELSDDVYLLNAGIQLTAKELEMLFSKPENKSNTMKRIFLRYAEENGIEPPFDIRTWDDGSREALNALQGYKSVVKQLCREDFPGSNSVGHFKSPAKALKTNLVRRAFCVD